MNNLEAGQTPGTKLDRQLERQIRYVEQFFISPYFSYQSSMQQLMPPRSLKYIQHPLMTTVSLVQTQIQLRRSSVYLRISVHICVYDQCMTFFKCLRSFFFPSFFFLSFFFFITACQQKVTFFFLVVCFFHAACDTLHKPSMCRSSCGANLKTLL